MTYSEDSIKRIVKKAKNHTKNKEEMKEIDDWKVAAVEILIHMKLTFDAQKKAREDYERKVELTLDEDKIRILSAGKEADKEKQKVIDIKSSSAKTPKKKISTNYVFSILKHFGFDVKEKTVRSFYSQLYKKSENVVREDMPSGLRKSIPGNNGGQCYIYEYRTDEEIEEENQRKEDLRMKMAEACGGTI